MQEVKKIEPVKNIYELTAADVATLKQMIKEDKQGRRGSSSNKGFFDEVKHIEEMEKLYNENFYR